MNTGRVFWGVLLLVVGGLFLLSNLGWYYPNWSGIWRLWPVVLVLWGISALVPNRNIKWIIAACMAILLGMILFWIFSFGWIDSERSFVRGETSIQHLNQPYSSDIQKAVLHVEAGATRIELDGTTSDLVEMEARSQFGEYDLTTTREGGATRVGVSFHPDRVQWGFGSMRRSYARLKLHPEVTWDLGMKIGAARADLDFSPFKTERIHIEAGATSIRLRLGDRSPETSVEIDAGVTAVVIEIPTGVGCRVHAHAPLSKKSFRGLQKLGDGRYESGNYDEAAKKINIEIDAGVSKLVVKQY
ncbi:MAG: hypothetical protein FJ215_11220 [Ignavibacteria bacterium]|nr:hypothetical protein [Ignavibacteria bacterium]